MDPSLAPGRLVLGGHSFISQLGTDPAPDLDLQTEIVAACLAHGITWFDTTYLPERVALGRALERLGARDRATILAWNFFTDFGPDDPVGGADPYHPDSLDQMLDQLRTDRIDILVVHPVADPDDQARQEALAVEWAAAGKVGRLGTWSPGVGAARGPYTLVVDPCNVATPDAAPRFGHYRSVGWETLATSPFVRGWEMERRIAESGAPKERVADALLRHSAFAPGVDRLVVAMRRPEWVEANVASLARGPLSADERAAVGI